MSIRRSIVKTSNINSSVAVCALLFKNWQNRLTITPFCKYIILINSVFQTKSLVSLNCRLSFVQLCPSIMPFFLTSEVAKITWLIVLLGFGCQSLGHCLTRL